MTSSTAATAERQPVPDAPRRACIPLSHKRVPTEMRSPHDHDSLLYAALVVRDVDVTAPRAHLTALPEEQWQEVYNKTHTVYFQRPIHDKVGVNNIVCLFSDTPLENVYELPLYTSYQRFLEPVFERMGVHPSHVLYPHAKLIVMLHDSVKRALHYQMTADAHGEPTRGKSFEQIMDEALALLAHAAQYGARWFVGCGVYALQLALWLREFLHEKLLVVDLDAMKTHEGTHPVAHDAFDVLDVEPHDVEDTKCKSTRSYGAIDAATGQCLRALYAPLTSSPSNCSTARSACWSGNGAL